MNLYILPKSSNSILKSKAMNPFRFTWVLSLLLFLTFQVASAQIQGCSLLGLDIQECLDQDENSALIDNCCEALNQAVQAGYYCLCLLLQRFSTPLQGIALSLKLSNCYISVPQLTQCQSKIWTHDFFFSLLIIRAQFLDFLFLIWFWTINFHDFLLLMQSRCLYFSHQLLLLQMIPWWHFRPKVMKSL